MRWQQTSSVLLKNIRFYLDVVCRGTTHSLEILVVVIWETLHIVALECDRHVVNPGKVISHVFNDFLSESEVVRKVVLLPGIIVRVDRAAVAIIHEFGEVPPPLFLLR